MPDEVLRAYLAPPGKRLLGLALGDPHLEGVQSTLGLNGQSFFLVWVLDVAATDVEDDLAACAHNLRNTEEWTVDARNLGSQPTVEPLAADRVELLGSFVRDRAPVGHFVVAIGVRLRGLYHAHLTFPCLLYTSPSPRD